MKSQPSKASKLFVLYAQTVSSPEHLPLIGHKSKNSIGLS